MGGDAVSVTVEDVPTPDLWQCQGTPADPGQAESRDIATGALLRKGRPPREATPCTYRTRDPDRKLLGGFAEAVCPFHGRGAFLPWS